VKQRIEAVVDDLPSGNDRFGFRERGKIVLAEPVEDLPIIGDERLNAVRVENVESVDNAAPVAALEDVGIPAQQLRVHPRFEKLDARLIVVRLPEYRRISGIGRLQPNAILQLNEFHAVFGDVAANGRVTREDRGHRQAMIWTELRNVALPEAGLRLSDQGPPSPMI
jgi:hypothetical protein